MRSKCELIAIPLIIAVSMIAISAESQKVEKQDVSKHIKLVWAGAGDTNILCRVADLLKVSFRCEFLIGGRIEELKDPSSAEEIQRLASLKQPDTMFLIVLTDMPKSSFVEKAYKEAGVAVINIAASKPTKASGKEPLSVLHVKRIQRESVRMVASLLGLGICVSPQCAMSVAMSEGELDQKSLNLCPPCAVKAEEALRRRGALRQFSKPPVLK